MASGVEVSEVGKSYDGNVALQDVSFHLPNGSVTGVIGPNGCGKSTLFRLMVGLTAGDGEVTYDGRGLSTYANPADIVGLAQGSVGLPPRRTLNEHLRLLCRLSGVEMERVDQLVGAVGLSSVANEYPTNYSYGMMQRASLACAMISRPKTLLLDEPMNGLDPSGVVAVRDFARDYADQGGAVLISSHILAGLEEVCDQIVVLSRGILLALGRPAELIASHGSPTIFVRTDDDLALGHCLTSEGLDWRSSRGGMEVVGCTTRRVGEIARDAAVAVIELRHSDGSLQDVYMQLLKPTEEYALALA